MNPVDRYACEGAVMGLLHNVKTLGASCSRII